MDKETEYSCAWVTSDVCLSHGACELLYAYLVVSAASTNSNIYNGENATGELMVTLKSAAVTGHAFSPSKPVYCRRGLYIDVGDNVSGIFVQWRELGVPK